MALEQDTAYLGTQGASFPDTFIGRSSAPAVCGQATYSVLEALRGVHLLTLPYLSRCLCFLAPSPKPVSQSDCGQERTPLSSIQKIPFSCPRIPRHRPCFHKGNGTVGATALLADPEVMAAKTRSCAGL